jgi:hypothetical protein
LAAALPEDSILLAKSSAPEGSDFGMGGIFISYRRDDSAATVGRIYDRLIANFGRAAVFKDVDSIPIGVNFHPYIDSVMRQCNVALVVIGPRWLTAANAAGRRLDDPEDVVRQEIEIALRLGLVIVPVLVESATMPSAGALPATLQELAGRNGVSVRYDPDFENDMRRLVGALQRLLPPPSGWTPPQAARPAQPTTPPRSPASKRPRAPLRRQPWLRWGVTFGIVQIALVGALVGILVQLNGQPLTTWESFSPYVWIFIIGTALVPALASMITTWRTGKISDGLLSGLTASVLGWSALFATLIVAQIVGPGETALGGALLALICLLLLFGVALASLLLALLGGLLARAPRLLNLLLTRMWRSQPKPQPRTASTGAVSKDDASGQQ